MTPEKLAERGIRIGYEQGRTPDESCYVEAELQPNNSLLITKIIFGEEADHIARVCAMLEVE